MKFGRMRGDSPGMNCDSVECIPSAHSAPMHSLNEISIAILGHLHGQ